MTDKRPGFMLYFNRFAYLFETGADDATIGRFIRAAYIYAKYGIEPDFPERDAQMWGGVKLAIDEDQQIYTQRVEKRRYANYCRWERSVNRDPVPFDEWKRISADNK